MSEQWTFEQIGLIRSCYQEKFGIPRQPGLVPEATATLEISAPWNRDEAFTGLEGFSHLWVFFIFHQALKSKEDWRPTVRPPRLGGNKRQGVFATRSPYRPNPLGLSVVKFDGIERIHKKLRLHVSGGDFLDGTPLVDIKPYLPYADALPDAQGGFAHLAPESGAFAVSFSPEAQLTLDQAANGGILKKLIQRTLKHDPRPAYYGHVRQREQFGMLLSGYNVQWHIDADKQCITVTGLIAQ